VCRRVRGDGLYLDSAIRERHDVVLDRELMTSAGLATGIMAALIA